MKVLVLGASGMLGNAVMRVFSERPDWEVCGTVRSESVKKLFPPDIAARLVAGIDVGQQDSLVRVFTKVRPDVVINCIGLIKQVIKQEDPIQEILLNSVLPHRLAELCGLGDARLLHVSTDCVFLGDKGGYVESDPSDAADLYGKSKYLGEVSDSHAVTLRTSVIGHELQSAHGLIEWFLSQEGSCRGYRRAIFSGLPTVVLAEIMRDIVIPDASLSGLYHISSEPISKFDLLNLVAKVYEKPIEIFPDDQLAIDRSLNSERFRKATGYVAPQWSELVRKMHSFG